MPFNELEKVRIDRIVGGFCRERIPDYLRSQIKVYYEIRGHEVRILQSRPSYVKSYLWADSPIARLKFDPNTMEWVLFWMRSSGKWQKYTDLQPTRNLQSLIGMIAEDRYAVFWG